MEQRRCAGLDVADDTGSGGGVPGVVEHVLCLGGAVGLEEVPDLGDLSAGSDPDLLAFAEVEWTMESAVLMELALDHPIVVPVAMGPIHSFLAKC